MRRILTLLVVLGVLLLVADRGAVALAERGLDDRITSQGVQRATAKVRGFPFLTQAVRGRYDQVDVSASQIDRGGVRIARLDASLRGIEVPLSEVLRGEVTAVPVAEVDASAVVTYIDLAHRSGVMGLTIEPAGDLVRVTGRVRVLGRSVTASATSRVALRNNAIVVTARSVRVLGRSTPAVMSALTGALDLRAPVGQLPYGLRLTGLRITSEGVVLQARATDTVLTAS